jgi:hypothetical protein
MATVLQRLLEVMSRRRREIIPRRDLRTPVGLGELTPIWRLDQAQLGSIADNVTSARGCPPFEPETLRQAVSAVRARHEALRWKVVAQGEQVFFAETEGPVPVPVLSPTPIDEEAGRALAMEFGGRRFGEGAALWRLGQVPLADARTLLVVSIHHVIADARACDIVLDEVLEAYQALARGQSPTWGSAPVQYGDVLAWERSGERADDRSRELVYWRSHLARMSPLILRRDPSDSDTVRSFAYLEWAKEASAAAHELADRHDATLFMILLAALDVALFRASGAADLAVGCHVANRVRSGTDSTVGLLSNVVLLRSDLRDDPTLAEVIARSRAVVLGAIEASDVRFLNVLAECPQARARGRYAFAVSMDYIRQNDSENGFFLPWTPMNHPLAVTAAEQPNRLGLVFDYDGGAFEPAQLEALSAAMRDAVERMVTRPQARLREFPPFEAPLFSQPAAAVHPPYAAPRTRIEEVLCAVWAEVLGIDRVGILDNFFELGGHSVNALRLVAKASERLGASVPIQWVFRTPSVAGMAKALASETRTAPAGKGSWWTAGLAVEPAGEPVGTSPLSYPEERFFRLDKSPVDVANVIMFDGRELSGALDPDAMAMAVAKVVERHDVFRSRYEEESETRQVKTVAVRVPTPFRFEDLSALGESGAREALLERLRRLAGWHPRATAEPPLLKVELYRLTPTRHALAFAVHHITFDGTSLGLFWSDLASCYRAAVEPGSPPLTPALPCVHFSRWQRQLFAGPALEEGRAFWRDHLAGAVPINRALGGDRMARVDALREGNPIAPVPCQRVQSKVPEAVAARLHQVAAEAETHLFALFYGAFAASLGRTAGITDVTVSSANDLRTRVAGLDRTIGFLVNSALLRLDLSGNPTFREVVARASMQARRVLSTPEFQLVPLLYPHINDLFRVLFNFREAGRPLVWPGLELSELPRESSYRRSGDAAMFLDLDVAIGPDGEGGYRINAFYNQLLWTEEQAQGLVERCASILTRGATEPSLRFEQF